MMSDEQLFLSHLPILPMTQLPLLLQLLAALLSYSIIPGPVQDLPWVGVQGSHPPGHVCWEGSMGPSVHCTQSCR